MSKQKGFHFPPTPEKEGRVKKADLALLNPPPVYFACWLPEILCIFSKTMMDMQPSFSSPSTVPTFLLAEEVNGIPFYYRGYQKVLSGEATLEEIMGSSVLQFLILQHIFRALALKDPEEERYLIGNNEAGLHMGPNSNVGNDLAIYRIGQLGPENMIGKYSNIPPEVVVEVDIQVENSQMGVMDGVYLKTQKMLDFGVQQVIWFFTQSQKVLLADSSGPWQTLNWDREVQIIDGLMVNVAAYLRKKGALS
ncbi:MAG: Uma2 family endonuclease [Bacteroidota bacterium]